MYFRSISLCIQPTRHYRNKARLIFLRLSRLLTPNLAYRHHFFDRWSVSNTDNRKA
nr:MAG TPA: hypothetical protein [Caudoviricetes sp.]